MLAALPLKVSHHAVQQYRNRVLACPERSRSNKALRYLIEEQVTFGKWECAGGETFEIKCGLTMPKAKKRWEHKVASVTYRYVIECQTVVTVLGFMMRPDHRRIQRRRRRQRLAALPHLFNNRVSE